MIETTPNLPEKGNIKHIISITNKFISFVSESDYDNFQTILDRTTEMAEKGIPITCPLRDTMVVARFKNSWHRGFIKDILEKKIAVILIDSLFYCELRLSDLRYVEPSLWELDVVTHKYKVIDFDNDEGEEIVMFDLINDCRVKFKLRIFRYYSFDFILISHS